MRALIGVLRLVLVLLAVVPGVAVCALAGVMSRHRFGQLAMRWHRLMLSALGVRSRYRGADRVDGALLVSNHISWLDGLVFGAHWPVTFLGNHEITSWPVLGWAIARSGALLFIERGRGAARAIDEIDAALQRRHSVVLFPEGITTDGRSVIRFQPRLMQAAINANAPLQPAAIRYFDTAGRRVVRHSFAGDTTLVQSLWRTMSGAKIIAEITLFAPLPPSDDRQALATQAERTIRALGEPGNHACGQVRRSALTLHENRLIYTYLLQT